MNETPAEPTLRRRVWRALRTASLIVAALSVLLPFGSGYVGMLGLVRPACADYGGMPAQYGLAFTEISFAVANAGARKGFFIRGAGEPFRAEAAIIVSPAFNGGRDVALDEAAALARAGYHVLTYESRACAGLPTSLGYRDSEDIGGAIAYLSQTAGIDPDRIALHGFSSAGAASTMALARYPDVRGAVAEGGYHNMYEVMGVGLPRTLIENLIQWGMQAAYRLNTGDDIGVLDPVGALNALPGVPGRGLFLVYGSDEPSLPGAQRQLARLKSLDAAFMTALWIVPEAGHGGYLGAAGEAEYTRQVTAFYDCLFFARCEAWEAQWGTGKIN